MKTIFTWGNGEMHEPQGKRTALAVLSPSDLAKRDVAIVKQIKGEIKAIKLEERKVEKDINIAKRMSVPACLSNIDEIKRRSQCRKRSRYHGFSDGMLDAGLKWLNELEIKRAELISNQEHLSGEMDIIINREKTPKQAYKLIYVEAKRVGIRMPRYISENDAKRAYRRLAKLYAPHNYAVYKDCIKIPESESEKKFKEIIIQIGGAYEIIAKRNRRAAANSD